MGIYKYDREALPDRDTAEQISNIYVSEYPPTHETSSRAKDLSIRDTPEKVITLLQDEDRTIITVTSTQDRVLGVLEMRFVELSDGIYAQLCWILVDTMARGTWLGEDLYGAFEQEVRRFTKTATKPVAQLLWVHRDNPARELYKKWGFVDGKDSTDGKIFMYKW